MASAELKGKKIGISVDGNEEAISAHVGTTQRVKYEKYKLSIIAGQLSKTSLAPGKVDATWGGFSHRNFEKANQIEYRRQ